MLLQENTTSDDWTRELRGVIVNFADGGAVSKVSTPWDSSAVRLDNVPRGSSPASVAALLSSLGLVVTADDVRVTEVAGATNCSAIIMVDDPMFAKRVCDTLRGSAAAAAAAARVATHAAAAYASAAAATRASFIEAVPIPVLAPRGSSLHLVDCKRVQCSWHRPTRTAYLDFGAKNVAQEVLERFNSGAYSVPGCHVKAKAPPGEWDDCQDPLAWTVMLTDL